MADKNLHIIKKAVYNKLSGDTTLIGLLGSNKIYYAQNLTTPQYPSVIYEVIEEVDNPYNEDSDEGKITETTLSITVFSDNSKSEECDNIEARIKMVLHGQSKLTTDSVICFSCFKLYSNQRRDVEKKLWITTSMYRLTSAPVE